MSTPAKRVLADLADHYQSLEQRPSEIEPIWEAAEEGETLGLMFRVRTDGWSAYPNERTDLHDGLSTLFAVFLRIRNGISCALWDEVHPITGIDTELYSRYITLGQPDGFSLPADESGAGVIKDALSSLPAFARWFITHTDWLPALSERAEEEATGPTPVDEWASQILGALPKESAKLESQWMHRVNPPWRHFRSVRPSVTVLRVPGLAECTRNALTAKQRWTTLQGPSQTFFLSELSSHAVGHKDVRNLHRVMRACEPTTRPSEVLLVPLENRLVAVGRHHFVTLLCESGRKRFERERARIRETYRETITSLYPAQHFRWSESIDDERFELLIMELVRREPSVLWVRKVGSSKDRDGGRDLLATWTTPPLPGEALSLDETPSRERRVIVQCKAYRRPVDKSRVRDIRDLLEHHDANGYLLAVSSTITSGLFDHLDHLRRRGRFWIDWWTRTEIEEKLQAHPDIIGWFSDVVRVVDAPAPL
ncbi:MAG TPA: restriction endonuclease [Longimicrobium sp.]|jgi:hypothetical protein